MIFPINCHGVIEELRTFFADENNTLKLFVTAEIYTCNTVLKILNEPTRWLKGSDIDSCYNLIENALNCDVAFYRTISTYKHKPLQSII